MADCFILPVLFFPDSYNIVIRLFFKRHLQRLGYGNKFPPRTCRGLKDKKAERQKGNFMAIYRLSLKNFSKSNCKYPAIAAMAYRSGTKIGKYNYTSKAKEILYSDIFLPAGNDTVDREKLWTDCFTAEKKSNARWGREFCLALPKEMNLDQMKALVSEFCKYMTEHYNTALDCNIHLPAKKELWKPDDKKVDEEDSQQSINYHAHIMMSCREYENNTFGSKSDFEIRDGDAKAKGLKVQREQLKEIRQVWQDIQNKHLQQCNIYQTVSCKSNRERGLPSFPEPKVPRKQIVAYHRNGTISPKLQELFDIREINNKMLSPCTGNYKAQE